MRLNSTQILAPLLLSALIVGLAVEPARTQGFPERPIRLVVPYAPGGTVDILARSIGEAMSPLLGQPVIVENKPGAGGTVAGGYVARSTPDGYTLFVSDVGPLAISRNIYKDAGYDPVKDFQPITLGTVSSLTVSVNPSVPVKNVKELVALAKSQPGKINFSSSGVGSIIHTAGELFNLMGGVDMVHVPYRGGAPAVNAVLAGEVQVGFLALPTTVSLAHAGKIRILAVTQGKRSRLTPEIPTVAESGVVSLAGYDVTVWQGIVAPKGTPREIVEKLHAAIVAALNKPEVNARLTGLGFDVVTDSPEEFGEMMRNEADKWERVMKNAKTRAR